MKDDKYAAQKRYQEKNMLPVKASYKKEFVQEFKDACKKLGITQSDVIRSAMIDAIEKANKK